jgi:molecular chaperone DnaJ
MMDAIKLMLSGIMLMLIAVFLIFCDAGNPALLVAAVAVILFVIGLFQRTDDTPMSLDPLPQKTCPNCGGSGQVRVQQRTAFGIMQSSKACENCRGTGKIIENKCNSCKGTGFVRASKKLEVNIPAGIDDGQQIGLRYQGSDGMNGGPSGDLNLIIQVRPHSVFERDGDDIYCEVPISFAEATLGAEIDIPILGGGTEKFRIPDGTQSGTNFTIKNKGIPDINTKRKGDMTITVAVETPKNLNSKQKDLLMAFAESLGENNSTKKQSFFKKFFK